MIEKKCAAEKAIGYVENGMTVGLGTGSTAAFAIEALAEKVKHGLNVKAVASSIRSEELAASMGIKIFPFSEIDHIDLYIDGADAVDPQLNLVKGGGGALLREKILAYNSRRFVVIVDESKMVDRVEKFPLPVELVSFGASLTLHQIARMGCKPLIRMNGEKKFITDNGNLVADCKFEVIDDLSALDGALHKIPGVVEHGFFPFTMVNVVIVGHKDGTTTEISSQ